MDSEKQKLLWEFSKKVTGAEWMATKQPKSPCPTLRVISAVTEVLDNMEELQRNVHQRHLQITWHIEILVIMHEMVLLQFPLNTLLID